MPIEYLAPNSIVQASSQWITPTLADVQDDPENYANDTTFWEEDGRASGNRTVRFSFALPTKALRSGADLQKIHMGYDKDHGYGNTIYLRIYDQSTLIDQASITTSNTQKGKLEVTFDSSTLSDSYGANLVAEFESTTHMISNMLGTTYWSSTIGSIQFIADTTDQVIVDPPLATIISVDKSRISDEVGADRSIVTFSFDKDIQAYSVNVGGTSETTGTIAHSGTGVVVSGTEIQAEIDWTELGGEGQNRINIYGQGTDGSWTPYEG